MLEVLLFKKKNYQQTAPEPHGTGAIFKNQKKIMQGKAQNKTVLDGGLIITQNTRTKKLRCVFTIEMPLKTFFDSASTIANIEKSLKGKAVSVGIYGHKITKDKKRIAKCSIVFGSEYLREAHNVLQIFNDLMQNLPLNMRCKTYFEMPKIKKGDKVYMREETEDGEQITHPTEVQSVYGEWCLVQNSNFENEWVRTEYLTLQKYAEV